MYNLFNASIGQSQIAACESHNLKKNGEKNLFSVNLRGKF